jgi:L,D-transpeptidase YcbB
VSLRCNARGEAVKLGDGNDLSLACLGVIALGLSACATANSGNEEHSRVQVPSQARPAEAQPWLNSGQQPLRSQVPLFGQVRLDALQRAERQYREIVAAGGWPTLSQDTRRDARADQSEELSRRLFVSGDLSQRNTGFATTGSSPGLAGGLSRFQERHGLRATGRLDAATLKALNVPAEQRLAQIRASIRRIRSDAPSLAMESRYVVVNIPAFELEAVEGQRVVQRHRVIVGRPDRQTPEVGAKIAALNLLPYWHVPESIVRRDLVPQVRKQPSYLVRHNIRVLKSWQGGEIPLSSINWRSPAVAQFKFRQDPGPGNALGLVRLDMPNKYAVYMHDTPMKVLFRQRQRAISAGCVRVDGVVDLASWVLRDDPRWHGVQLRDAIAEGRQMDLPLAKPVQVRFVYITAWASPDGRVSFRPDIYGRDSSGGPQGSSFEPRSKRRFDISP